jgi:hypothetical protein
MSYNEELDEFIEKWGGRVKFFNRNVRCGPVCEAKIKNVLGYTSEDYEFSSEESTLYLSERECARKVLKFLKERQKEYCCYMVRNCKGGANEDPVLTHLHLLHEKMDMIEKTLSMLEKKC